MSDLISRRMMLDKMISHKSLFSTNQYEYMALSEVDKAKADEIDNCIADLRNAPDAETERKWIPITERLPEEEKEVLVSVHFEGFKGKTVDLPPSDYVEIASHVEGLWSSLSDEYKVAWKKHHVVAWAKLPEPWRGEE